VDDLDRLLSLEAIRDLARRYALAADGKDLDAMAFLFAPDVDNGRWGPGRDGVKAFYAQSLRKFHCSVHLVANHVVDFADDHRAAGVVYCRASHHVLEPEHWYDEALAYFDSYERIDGEWLFRRRRLRSWYRQHFGHPECGTERTVPAIEESGPKRGARMPEAFPTFEPFWSSSPR
jgi:hypothetical protein